MSFKAVEVLDDTVQSTKRLLLPVDRSTWIRLMVLVIFTGGGMSFASFPPIPSDDTGTDYQSSDYTSLDSSAVNVSDIGQFTGAATSASLGILFLVLILVAGALMFLFWLSSVFQFVYYQSLVDEDVIIRENFRKHAWNGLAYMAFRILLTIIVLALLAGAVAGFALNIELGILGLIFFMPLLVATAVISGLINNLAIPEMIKEDRGILNAVRTTFGLIRSEFREISFYILVRFGIGLLISAGVFSGLMMVFILFLLLFGIMAFVLGVVSPVLAVLVVVAGVILFAVVALIIKVPVQTFMYFYALRFYEEL